MTHSWIAFVSLKERASADATLSQHARISESAKLAMREWLR
jgi:hypothetical protein